MKLDHLIQYEVENVDGHDLIFEGTAKLVATRNWAGSLKGQRLMEVAEKGDDVVLYFNEAKTTLSKNKLVIVDEYGTEYKPFEPVDIHADLPPDPSAERITPGPTDEEVRRDLRGIQSEDEEAQSGSEPSQ